jgi:hypothetical protein
VTLAPVVCCRRSRANHPMLTPRRSTRTNSNEWPMDHATTNLLHGRRTDDAERAAASHTTKVRISPACLPHQPLASGQPTALRCTSTPRRPARAIRDRPSAGRYGTSPWTLPMWPEQSRLATAPG